MPDHVSTPRQIADRYVERLADLNPFVGTALGIRPGSDAVPDFSPAGQEQLAAAQRATLAELAAVDGPDLPAVERRAARLLRERLTAALALYDSGDGLRQVSNLMSPVQSMRSIFLLMPTDSVDDWAVIARRLARIPEVVRGYRAALAKGADGGLLAAPRQIETVAEQLSAWTEPNWFAEFVADGPDELRNELTAAASAAAAALVELATYLTGEYAEAAVGTPDAVGAERYARHVRQWTGADIDLHEAYAYGWAELARLNAEMDAAAEAILPGSTAAEAMRHLDEHGEAIDGVDEVRDWLQQLMDRAIDDLDGSHVDLAEPVRHVEAMIAPPGSAAAPYYSRPSLDFSRPGRTWLPTMGRERFPTWGLVSTWFHEGVPGHHLQLAQWVHVQDQLSRYQVSVGSVSAATEGWALYAERLMDELGYLADPAYRIGYLDAQRLRAVRVVIDIGMHLRLEIPADADFHPGERWTPELGHEFLARHCGREQAFIDSEIVRYLGIPGQAISYKLGERAWLAGRDAARATQGEQFDLKAWHMEALSLGSLGLDDLAAELAELP